MASRKRRAPGASPRIQQQPGMQSGVFPQDASMTNEQFTHGWNDTPMEGDLNAAFGDTSFFDYTGSLGAAGGQPTHPTHSRIVSLDGINDIAAAGGDINSGQLVRRNPNQQLAARRSSPWAGDAYRNNEQGEFQTAVEDEDGELEAKAMLARKDAQSKRKQIPPFVQKLSSFLDDNKNHNLIRWSDDGTSFIVIDEDEFARTLIPELFKHNNYASFVRQLNMYGFHKKVGLSDNSMKASELKAKAPSEYYNKYFRRGRPELLWLIQKPKNTAAGPKRKREDDGVKGDSDEDRKYVPDAGGGGHYAEDLAVRGNQEMAMIPRTEYNSLRGEVRALQQQQKMISNVLSTIRRQNDELYQQATNFRSLHERHENSINAILTFLATFYDRSLQGGNGANLANLFHPMANQQPHGNVVDVEEFPEKAYEQPANQMQMQRAAKRNQQLLLPAPIAKDAATKGGRATTLSPSVLSSGGSPISKPASRPAVFRAPSSNSRSTSNSTNVTSQQSTAGPSHIKPKIETPPTPHPTSLPESSEIMSAIHSANNANASNSHSTTQGPHFDLPTALANYTSQGGNVPLTPQQRNDVLSLMASNASSAANSNPNNPNSAPNNFDIQNSNNAMVNPHPPAMPDLSQYEATQSQLDMLQKLSEEQGSRVQSLQERLQPLSPSGSIPGLGDGEYFGGASMGGGLAGLGEPGQYDLDLDSFVTDADFFPNNATNSGGQNGMTSTAGHGHVEIPDFPSFDLPDHNMAGDAGMNGAGFENGMGNAGHHGHEADMLGFDGVNDDGGRVESINSSNVASPAVTVEDVDDAGEEGMNRPGRPSPKRRKNQ